MFLLPDVRPGRVRCPPEAWLVCVLGGKISVSLVVFFNRTVIPIYHIVASCPESVFVFLSDFLIFVCDILHCKSRKYEYS